MFNGKDKVWSEKIPDRFSHLLSEALSKSPEERAEESAKAKETLAWLEKESQEAREKLRKELEHELEECDKEEYVKFALSHSKEPSEIRQHVRNNSISDDDAFQKLSGLNSTLEYRVVSHNLCW